MTRTIGLKHSNKKSLEYLLLILFCVDFILPTVIPKIAFNIPFTYPLFYYISGYYFSKYSNKKRSNKKLICIMIALLAILLLLNLVNVNAADLWAHYNSLLTALLALTIFMLFDSITSAPTKFIWDVDRLCFTAYLIHPVLIQFMYRKLGKVPYNCATYPLATIGYWIFFTVVAFVGSWIIYKIKPLREYVL